MISQVKYGLSFGTSDFDYISKFQDTSLVGKVFLSTCFPTMNEDDPPTPNSKLATHSGREAKAQSWSGRALKCAELRCAKFPKEGRGGGGGEEPAAADPPPSNAIEAIKVH